jgi:hypothetical protein
MDLTAQIIEAITAWLGSVATQLLAPALESAGQLVFATPPFDAIPEVGTTWSLMRNITDGLLLLALTAAGVMVMASGTFDSRYTAKVLVPRLVLAAVGANASLALCGALIRLDNALVVGFMGPQPGATVLRELASMVLSGGGINQIVGIVMGLATAVLAILLVVLYIARDLVLLVLTVLGPLALATYALPQTDELARTWTRVYCALLFVQVIQALLITIAVQLLRRTDWLGGPVSDLTSGLVLLTLLYVLFKLPFAAYQWSVHHSFGRSAPVQSVLIAARSLKGAVA